jgi:hypothetical protein
VQVWEQSYTFTEDELALFAESQKKLSQPFNVSVMIAKILSFDLVDIE